MIASSHHTRQRDALIDVRDFWRLPLVLGDQESTHVDHPTGERFRCVGKVADRLGSSKLSQYRHCLHRCYFLARLARFSSFSFHWLPCHANIAFRGCLEIVPPKATFLSLSVKWQVPSLMKRPCAEKLSSTRFLVCLRTWDCTDAAASLDRLRSDNGSRRRSRFESYGFDVAELYSTEVDVLLELGSYHWR